MVKAKKPDSILFFILAFLMIWGFFTLATVSFPLSLKNFGNSWFYAKHQFLFGILPGLILGFIAYKLPLKTLKKLALPAFLFSFFLLVLVFVPGLGTEINGARRWLKLGGGMFQPSEFIKLTFILYLSVWLANKIGKRKAGKKSKQAFAVLFVLVLAFIGVLGIQSDLSTLIIIFLIGMAIYFSSSVPLWHYVCLLIIFAIAAGIFSYFEPYRMSRIMTTLNPSLDPMGSGYQLKQSLIAIGSGKLFGIGEFLGSGIGMSRQKFGFLPQSITDSIFSIVGEELGFIGASLLIFTFVALLWRCLFLAGKTKEEFSKLLLVGISVWLVGQAFFNISGIIGILPLAGIPFTFFSYGSSHLLTEIVACGIILNISKHI